MRAAAFWVLRVSAKCQFVPDPLEGDFHAKILEAKIDNNDTKEITDRLLKLGLLVQTCVE